MTDYHAAVAGVFDRVAPAYDGILETNPLHQAMRKVSLATLRRIFHAGDRVLDVGCGTGVEAVELAREGIRVVATDVSQAMVARTRDRAAREAVDDRLECTVSPAAGLSELLRAEPPFDGAYSSFGPLNCEPDLGPVLDGLATLLRPGATLVLTLVNRVCLWEMALYLALGRPGKAFRRWRRPSRISVYDGGDVDVYVPSVEEVRWALAPRFTDVRWRGLLVLRPPPYLHRQYGRLRLDPARIALADERWSDATGFRSLGDHVLITARRR